MPWRSTSFIAEELGVTTRTVRKYCAELETRDGPKNSILYESQKAYRAILERRTDDDLDLQQERARLAKEQADKYEIENQLTKGIVVDGEETRENWQEVAAAVRAKLLSLPVKIARVSLAAESLQEIEQAARDEVYQALNELSEME